MKRLLYFLIVTLQFNVLSGQNIGDPLFNNAWKFHKGDLIKAEKYEFDDSDWRSLDLPHDWSIEDIALADTSNNRIISGPFDSEAIGGKNSGFTTGGTGWYRKHFKLSQKDSNKVVYVYFDGIYMNSDIWINGVHVFNQPYGFSGFWINLTNYLNYGDKENVIAVQVKNAGLSSRWYSGSGIYRNVALKIVNKIHVEPWGIFVSTPTANKKGAIISVQAMINNTCSENKDIVFKVNIKNLDNKVLATKEILTRVHHNIPSEVQMNISVDTPKLWSPGSPNLYKLSCHVLESNNIVDNYETFFGIRNIEFDSEEGMFLNGEPIKLKGGAVHANNGPLGATAYPMAEARRVRLLKEAGFNAVRCAHNPPSSAFLNECDRQGLLVIDESFDDWVVGWLKDDYKNYFYDYWKHDLGNMILRDRNHPAIFTWSIGNQIRNGRDSLAIAIAHKLAGYTRSLDPTRPVTANIAMLVSGNWLDGSPDLWKDYDALFSALDICGYSYQSAQYENVHKRLPDRIQFSSEINPKYCFKNWIRAVDNDYVVGNFTWTAMDYMGEASSGWLGFKLPPSVFPWHSTYCGDLDICGFRKPRSYYRDILFDNGKQISMFVHAPVPSFKGKNGSLWGWDDVKPSWTWNGYEGKTLQVDVYSKFEMVELFLNNISLGAKPTSRETEFKVSWDVEYQKGNLMAVGYKQGDKSDTCFLKTTDEPYAIKLTEEQNIIKANRQDLSFIVVEIIDKEGILVPYADNLVNFEIRGEGQLAAVGNGNPVSLESFQKPYRKAYEGKCLLIVKSTDNEGDIFIKAKSPGLKSGKLKIKTIKWAAGK